MLSQEYDNRSADTNEQFPDSETEGVSEPTTSGSGGGEVRDTYLISAYDSGTTSFSLRAANKTPFTEQLEFDFKKTVWYSRVDKLFFTNANAEQHFRNTNECGYHLYFSNQTLHTIYCYRDKQTKAYDVDRPPVLINEVIPKIRVKALHSDGGAKQVLVLGRKIVDDREGNSAMASHDQPIPANLNPLERKSFGIYVEDGAKLVVLDKHYACTNIRYHNNTLVTGGGFLVIEGELFIGQPIEGINLYNVQTEEPDKPNPVYFLEKTSSRSLCWGLAANSYGIWCLLVPDNAKFVVKNYESEGLWEVLQQHSRKPWSQTVEHQ